MAVMDGIAYFAAGAYEDGIGTDLELYRSDGTEAGTYRVKDIDPTASPMGSNPVPFASIEGRLYFAANDPVGGREVWRTDGTSEGTRPTGDINPGVADAEPAVGNWIGESALVLGSRLVFPARDGLATEPWSGTEMWAVDSEGPQVDAGPDQHIESGAEATLDGAATDPQGNTLDFEWRDTTGALLANTSTFSIELPVGIHGLTLTASHGTHRGSDSVLVRVGNSLELTVVTETYGGAGRVDADLGGSCALEVGNGPAVCELLFANGASVTLNATPEADSTFVGWSGECSGTGACQVTMDATRQVQARFEPPKYISVELTGEDGAEGALRVDPSGALCTLSEGFCPFAFPHGTTIQITPLPGPGTTFIGWSAEGPCAGAGTGVCSLTLDTDQSTGAAFRGASPQLTLWLSGGVGASGSVLLNPPGTWCSTDNEVCRETYADNTVVTLTPVPAPGSAFEGWSDPSCPGTGSCVVTMDTSRTVTATFRGADANQPPGVALTAPAQGTVYALAPAVVTLQADASDVDGAIALVEFFAGGNKIGESTAGPYQLAWNGVPAGSYTLTARATDDGGASSGSAPVTVIVNAPPTLSVTSPIPGASLVAPATVVLAADASDAAAPSSASSSSRARRAAGSTRPARTPSPGRASPPARTR